MCSWKRVHNLVKILNNLNKQSCSNNIIFHIWNNNISSKSEIDNIINIFNQSNPKIKIDVVHSDKNLFAFGRYHHMKLIKSSTQMDFAIIIDDDQLFSFNYMEKLYNLRKSNTFVTWYGCILKGRNYWNRDIINLTDLLHHKKYFIKEFEYGGPGGCVIDTNFLTTEFFDISDEYLIADDIWLSHYIRTKLQWRIMRSFLPPISLENDPLTQRESMWINYHKQKEDIFTKIIQKSDHVISHMDE